MRHLESWRYASIKIQIGEKYEILWRWACVMTLNEQILKNLEAEVMYCIQKENKDRLSYLYREIEKTEKEIEKEKKNDA